ncbi:MAG: S8 family serine peptidase [Chloroflexia bacterium]|nr:S8 family serine peptidase [Chloroflexia bacterium]
MHKRLFAVLVLLSVFVITSAQYSVKDNTFVQLQDTLTEAPKDWFNLDYQTDKVRGVSTEKAYAELLGNKKSTTVIVAILDSGIDIEHEDLKDQIWVNTKEIAGNGVDDDKNGYIDDINGWNFIGNAKGEMIDHDNLELTRLYVKYKKKFDGKSATDFNGKEREEFDFYQEIKKAYEKELQEAKTMNAMLGQFMIAYTKADSTIKSVLNKDEYTLEEVNAIENDSEDVSTAKQVFGTIAMMGATVDDLIEGVEHYKEQLEYNLNTEFEPRALVGDNYENKKEKFYGNNLVEGPDATHGTHVAGIIGANRNNEIGMKGIANDVKIMVIRTVPNGDERDKDVANAIYYAVDNGAQIINMSFGKDYSPDKEFVDKAVKYAEKKGVLIIHAAGNDGRDTDARRNYPHPEYDKSGKWASNWIEVGASSWEDKDGFAANFSNYGEKTVSVFAPGVAIYSTVPDNSYKNLQGTSMAAPVVTGIAALVLSYYPNLKAEDLRKIILESSVKYPDVEVNVPGTNNGKTEKFSKLCQTAGVVNAYNALKMAEGYKK